MFKNQSEELFHQIRDLRRKLHAHPELSFHEVETQGRVKDALKALGLRVEAPFDSYGLLVPILPINPDNASAPPLILRADMDALPIIEATELDYSSQNQGVMHACGHDMHMACLVGALKIIADNAGQLSAPVYGLFQPAEEKNPGGARAIVKSGILQRLQPRAIVAQHVNPNYPRGTIGFRPGLMMAAEDEIHIRVHGKGGHGGAPHSTVDAVLIACHLVTALQQVVSRQIPASIPSVLSFGILSAKGAYNVLPDHVDIGGTFRIVDETWRSHALEKIKSMAEQLAESMGGSCEVSYHRGYPAVHNDPGLNQNLSNSARDSGLFQDVVELPLVMWAEDFAYYSQVAPSVMYNLGVSPPQGTTGLHTATFCPDEEALIPGMAFMASIPFSAQLVRS